MKAHRAIEMVASRLSGRRATVVRRVLFLVGQPLWREGAEQHADDRGEQARQLLRKGGLEHGAGHEQQPYAQPHRHGQHGALCGGAPPVDAEDQRHEGADQRDLIRAGDQLVNG